MGRHRPERMAGGAMQLRLRALPLLDDAGQAASAMARHPGSRAAAKFL